MFASLSQALMTIGVGLITLGGAAATLAVVVLALMNMWAIFDPRMGQAVKGNLIRIALSGALLASAGAVQTIMASLGGAVPTP